MLIIRYARTNAVRLLQCFFRAETRCYRTPAITCARYRPIRRLCVSCSYASTVSEIGQKPQVCRACPAHGSYHPRVHSAGHSIIAPNQQTEGRARVRRTIRRLNWGGARVGRTGPHSLPTGTLIRCCHQYTHGGARGGSAFEGSCIHTRMREGLCTACVYLLTCGPPPSRRQIAAATAQRAAAIAASTPDDLRTAFQM